MIFKKTSLKQHHTFGVDVNADSFTSIHHIKELRSISKIATPLFILGEGSNVLLTQPIKSMLVAKMCLKGIEILEENHQTVLVRAYAGEHWDHFVSWCVDRDYGGLENLSLIPGTVGACPIQNIGAYGASVADFIEEVDIYCLQTHSFQKMKAADCMFGYRDSIFKNTLKNKTVIISVCFRLFKAPWHTLNISYTPLANWFNSTAKETIRMKEVRAAVIAIRKRKLPDTKLLGNAGSFFKNPLISPSLFAKLSRAYDVPCYPTPHPNKVKVAAAWLIEKTGWKGKRVGNCGVHSKQALVLVNYGGATGKEILALSKEVQKSVKQHFGIELETEINIIGS